MAKLCPISESGVVELFGHCASENIPEKKTTRKVESVIEILQPQIEVNMKLEMKVEQANSSSDEEDISQSSSEILLNRKVS